MKRDISYAGRAMLIMCLLAFAACSNETVQEPDYDDQDANESNTETVEYAFMIKMGDDTPEATDKEPLATYIDGSYLWDIDDKIAVYMFPAGSTDPSEAIFTNRIMDKQDAQQSKVTQFWSMMTEMEINSIDGNALYDYYFYGPNVGRVDITEDFPNIGYELGNQRTTTTDYFSCPYMMVRGSKTGTPPLTWLDESQQQLYAESTGFVYEHVFSFLNIQLDCNLMSQPVTRIDITALDGTPIAGRVNVNIMNGEVSIVGNSYSTISVLIPNGFDVLDNTIMVTMPPGDYLAGKQLRFTFYVTDDIGSYFEFYNTTINGGTLRAGTKHRVRFQLPFYVDFTHDMSRLGDILYEGMTLRQYRSCGHTITTNTSVTENLTFNCLDLAGAGRHRNRGCIKLPLLNYATDPSYTPRSHYVRVRVEASASVGYVDNASRRLLYDGVVSTEYDLSEGDSPAFQLAYYYNWLLQREFQEYDEGVNGPYAAQIGDDSYITFHATVVDWYNVLIRKIWIYPEFNYTP